jgi:hypothetical protein
LKLIGASLTHKEKTWKQVLPFCSPPLYSPFGSKGWHSLRPSFLSCHSGTFPLCMEQHCHKLQSSPSTPLSLPMMSSTLGRAPPKLFRPRLLTLLPDSMCHHLPADGTSRVPGRGQSQWRKRTRWRWQHKWRYFRSVISSLSLKCIFPLKAMYKG